MAEVAALSNKIASLEMEINALKEEIKALEGRTDDVSRQRLVAMAQEKAALAQQVAALQQEKVLLMQQQAGAAGAGAAGKLEEKWEEVDRKLVRLERLQLQAMSSTRHASSISPDDLSLVESALKIWWSSKGLDALSETASAVLEDTAEYTWNQNKHEAKHKEGYMKIFAEGLQLPPHLVWSARVDEPGILKTCLGTGGANLPFNIGCKTDALVVVRNAAVNIEGAVAATVELKKRAVKQSILQAKATWVCASLNSHLPVISAVTDIHNVFAAFYTEGQREDSSGSTICIQHMFPALDDLLAFMRNALSAAAIPKDVLKYCPDSSGHEKLVLADELPNPKRIRLPVPMQRHSSLWQNALRVLAEHAAGGSDVACLDDLRAFEDQDAPATDMPAYKHNMMYS